MSVKRAPRAQQDIEDIWWYTAHKSGNTEIADRLVDKIGETILLIADHPMIGRQRTEFQSDIRSLGVYKYIIFYRYRWPEVEIVRVLHGSRDIAAVLGHTKE